jgi:hypothetical protein
MESVTLHERTVTIGGYEYDQGNVRVVVMPRRIRIREFTDSQIEFRMLLAFFVGLVPFFVTAFAGLWWFVPAAISACP